MRHSRQARAWPGSKGTGHALATTVRARTRGHSSIGAEPLLPWPASQQLNLVMRMPDTVLQNTQNRRVALVVCGMHRTGTSAVARTFSLLGASLPDRLVPPNEGNPKGHWEPEKVVALNDQMLQAAGSDLYSVVDFDPAWFAAPGAADYLEAARGVLRQEYGDSRFIVVKDPRIC